MNSRAGPEWRVWLPYILVFLWVLYLAITIGQHAFNSVQVPWGDPLSYMQKAASFWKAVDKGGLFNPLDLWPTVRPPGTVLMSYPFGLSPDFHWFHFRSIFLPLLSIVTAVLIVPGKAPARASGWWIAAIAFLFSSLPMFYWLDWSEERFVNNGWGMVDNFQAGVAALAAAALVKSLATKSQTWLLTSALLASLTLLIKQSGLMAMGLVGLVWLIVIAFEWRSTSRASSPTSSLRAYALKGCAVFLAVYAPIVALCVSSEYLSRSNFAYAMKALGFYHEVATAPSLSLFHHSSGELLVVWLVAVGLLFVHRLMANGNHNSLLSARILGLVVGSLVIWILGAWYWLVVQAGGTQIRYFYPFMLAGIICMVPAALDVWPHTKRLTRSILMLICFLPALNIGALLAAGDSPSHYWQYLSGVSVTVPKEREEVRQAYAFLDEIRKRKKHMRVYYFNGVVPSMFAFVGAYEKIARPELPGFDPVAPMDWSRGFAVRVSEILDSDYILARKYGSQDIARLTPRQIDSFDIENQAFDAWLSTLDERAGVQVVSDGHTLRLLRIVEASGGLRPVRPSRSGAGPRTGIARAWRSSIDRILLQDMLEHVRNPTKLLTDCHRLLNPQGLLLVSVPNVANITVRMSLLFGRFEYAERGILDRTHLRFFTRKSARRMIEKAGYEIVAEKITVMPVEVALGLPADNPVTRAGNAALAVWTRMLPRLLGYQLLYSVRSRLGSSDSVTDKSLLGGSV